MSELLRRRRKRNDLERELEKSEDLEISARKITTDDVTEAAENIDWKQVGIHGGTPCFSVMHVPAVGGEPDEEVHRFCLKARRWHDESTGHAHVSLHEMLTVVIPPVEPIPEDAPQPLTRHRRESDEISGL